MNPPRLPELIDIGKGALGRLVAYCARRSRGSRLRLVADRRTWKAMGERLEAELRAASLRTRSTIFDEPYLAADERSVLALLVDDQVEEGLYLAVGSGTITDIVRFVCHRTRRDFVSVATAPSVDAYSSVVAPIIVDGMKRTVGAAAPIAIFAEPELLARAPRPMIAAGFGDMVCKFSAVADWRLGALLWGESLDEAIARRSVAAARGCVEAAADIGAARSGGVERLMAALVESGLCMALAGHSKPASGAEHQYSHFWEMRLLREGRPPILHGLKVGIGTLETAGLWDAVRGMSAEDAEERLRSASLPRRTEEEALVRTAFGADAAEVLAGQERFLGMGEAEFESLKSRIAASWAEIRELASSVPSRAETERLLALAGCPTQAGELGLGAEEVAAALAAAHYLRDRFTVRKLARLLGLAP